MRCRYWLSGGLLLLTSCSLLVLNQEGSNPYYRAELAHHTPNGFRNLNDDREVGRSYLRWQWQRWRAPSIEHHPEQIPRQKIDSSFWQPSSDLTLTWIGHSTALLQLDGLRILIDPFLLERASPLSFAGPKRLTQPALNVDELPHIDLVLISHNHYDHLELATVQALARQKGGAPQFVVPLGLERWFLNEGITKVQALDWWQSMQVNGVNVTLTPAQHWSKRRLLEPRNQTLWGGFVVSGTKQKFWFAGDTGYDDMLFKKIGQRWGGFDLALIPVGAYQPRWFMQYHHTNPADAVVIHQEVKARYSVGIHWGALTLGDEAIEQPLSDLATARQAARLNETAFELLPIGGQRRLPPVAPLEPTAQSNGK